MSFESRRLTLALLISLLIHALLLSLTFGGDGHGLPGIGLPWLERRIEAPDLRVVLMPAGTSAKEALPRAATGQTLAGEPESIPAVPFPPTQGWTAEALVPKAETTAQAEPVPGATTGAVPAQVPVRAEAPGEAASAPIPETAASAQERPSMTAAIVPAVPSPPPIIAVAQEAPSLKTEMQAASDADGAVQTQAEPEMKERPAEQDRSKAAKGRKAKRLAAARKEAARIEAERLEAQREEAARLAEAQLEAQRQESARQEAARVELARLEAQRQEAARLAAAQLEARRQESARQEAARVEAARQEAQRQEAARQEAARLETERQDALRRAAAQLEAQRQAAARIESQRQEAARLAAAQLEAQRQEAARQEAARAEAARLEAERQDALRRAAAQLEAQRQAAARLAAAQLETQRQETARQEAARIEAARQEAERPESQLQAAARQEAARVQAEKEEDARREARRRALGRQLEEEAAQREASANAPRPASTLPYSLSTARRVRLWGRSDPNVELVQYAESWARRIQFNTPVETVREVSKRPHTKPMVTVAVRSDGSVEAVTFVVSSGVAEVDEAIRRIVQSHAPYPRFPPALARQYDVVEIRRTWHFDMAIWLY